MKKHFLVLIMGLLCPLLHGQQSAGGAIDPATQTIAFDDVYIFQKKGKIIKKGDIIIKKGMIVAVGEKLDIPADAKVIKEDSLYLYPGFIDGFSHTGIPEPKRERSSGNPKVKDRNYPPLDLAGVQSDRIVMPFIDPTHKSIKQMREMGFLTAHVAPRGNMLPGKGALLFMHDGTVDDMVFNGNTGLFAQFSPSTKRVFPRTIIGVISKFQEMYKQAEQAQAYEMAYQTNPVGMERPTFSSEHQAFYPVIDGEHPIFFSADDIKPIYRAMDLQSELGFNMVLTNVKEGWYFKDQIKADKVPVLLSMDLPKYDDKETPKEMDEGQKALEKRRKEAMDKAISQAKVLADAGIPFGFTTIGTKASDIKKNLNKMIEAGLSEDMAIAALSENTATIFGVDKMMGTLEKGKIGNLMVSKHPYFKKGSSLEMVLVDGKIYEIESKKGKGNGGSKGSARE